VARLSWEKDHATLLRAFAKVAGDRPDLALLLIGDGELDGELAELGRQLGLGDRLKLVGHREDVPELLSVCRVNVLASICEETGALALQEAMAMEIPVIGPRRGIIPDYVRHGETGYLFEPGDADDLARWLALLVEDTDRTRALARNGRREILERFDLEEQKVRFCRFLEELHAGGKGEAHARSGLLKTQN
jgi:glycosyltransferase involved in cell wall biosynthesis